MTLPPWTIIRIILTPPELGLILAQSANVVPDEVLQLASHASVQCRHTSEWSSSMVCLGQIFPGILFSHLLDRVSNERIHVVAYVCGVGMGWLLGAVL